MDIKHMDIKQIIFVVMGTVFECSIAIASNMHYMTAYQKIHPVISLQGGYASVNTGDNTQIFTGTDSDAFIYSNSGSGKSTNFIGVFLGAEHALPWISLPDIFMQTGVEYNYFNKLNTNGINTVGIEPQESTSYNYNYNFQTQQILGVFKFFATSHEIFHPYGEIGFGVAFNYAGQYNTNTTETGSLNLTPGFSNQDDVQFSYSLGLGVDTQVNTQIRLGLGYRYSNFGSSYLGNGSVSLNNYNAPVPFAPGSSSIDAHQLMARVSYIIL